MVRSLAVPAYRNFENDGVTQYSCNHQGLDWGGARYNVGDALPFDVAGTSYSRDALQLLQLYWDQEWIVPTI
jgi:hypothetical protein